MVTLPAFGPVTAEMELVELDPAQPEGNVQVYPVAPETAKTEYASLSPEQTGVVPEMAPGCAGILLETET